MVTEKHDGNLLKEDHLTSKQTFPNFSIKNLFVSLEINIKMKGIDENNKFNKKTN